MPTMYGKTTFQSIPNEFITCHESWENYVACIWQNLLENYGLKNQDTIIEIAPGFSSKIGLALQKASFEGTIYLVDPLENALESVTSNYKRLLPKATIYPVNSTLEKSFALLPREPDLILANHPLDDMLLTFITKEITLDLFDCTSQSHRDCRQVLEAESQQPISSVINCWKDTIDFLKPKTMIICQYASLIQKQNNIHTLNNLAYEVLEGLKSNFPKMIVQSKILQKLLNEHENYNDRHIGEEVLNANNWMVYSTL